MRAMAKMHERFAAWLAFSGLSQSAMAARLGCSQVTISNIVRGECGVGVALAFRIERESSDWDEGPILAREWATETPSLPPDSTLPPSTPAVESR